MNVKMEAKPASSTVEKGEQLNARCVGLKYL